VVEYESDLNNRKALCQGISAIMRGLERVVTTPYSCPNILTLSALDMNAACQSWYSTTTQSPARGFLAIWNPRAIASVGYPEASENLIWRIAQRRLLVGLHNKYLSASMWRLGKFS
jgi:hypothetical protein